jgi:hypothetical protein
MPGITPATLTGAGFSAGTATQAGTPYTQSFGSIAVTVTLFTEAELSGSAAASGVLSVTPGTATSNQFTSFLTALSAIGFSQFAASMRANGVLTPPNSGGMLPAGNPGAMNVTLSAAGGQQSFSIGF